MDVAHTRVLQARLPKDHFFDVTMKKSVVEIDRVRPGLVELREQHSN